MQLEDMQLTPIKQDKEMNVYTRANVISVGETPIRWDVLLVYWSGIAKYEIVTGVIVAMVARNYIDLTNTDEQILSFHDKVGIRDSNSVRINTRTDTEKAIDDLADGISASYSDDQSFKEDARELLDLIKAGKIHGITFTGDK